jgi:hypothetical protein
MKSKRALIDTSSAILLQKAGIIEELLDTYKVIISKSVFDELLSKSREGAPDFFQYCSQKKIIISSDYSKDSLINLVLKGGERDIVLLYLNKAGDFIIVDDRDAARFCKFNSIPYINALLVPGILHYNNAITKKMRDDAFGKLKETGRYADWIIEYAASATPDMLKDFLVSA